MGLTIGQRSIIQNNWVTVASNIQEYGDELFSRYLSANPGDIDFFPQFVGDGEIFNFADLRSKPEFQDHTLTVMLFLSKIVACLTEIEVAGSLLQERVRTHFGRGISMAQFERMLDLMPRFLQETAGANGQCADAWRVAIATLLPFMRQEFSRCQAQ
ncbi:hypothetical protein CAPTEDRAFT_5226 [Capitella teleta]|uniref:Globin domain-containing protein n=1 Tax=Capitella teleta TaxID=283909 RepID=R7T850_CAPTE|nr:hypothetical protein CAPTEDRAFT_5226 [Capitella teleta]|eukprot:ELT87600.1 hypothetical protein CAPTEDRAFT_5226 [Capitella teleta]